jgi:hypothetical protein
MSDSEADGNPSKQKKARRPEATGLSFQSRIS